ncbi:diguanylate cyclase [candidate division TA06 bacterium]|uniref:Diguanylate cyclase n=1 Tax=candidate division TA06 bacterium TaxID=2250710 RepID=A0A523USX9_UNCT6|nr:MAG: diguanylate cyclase [candidate division TA06 bacterium]
MEIARSRRSSSILLLVLAGTIFLSSLLGAFYRPPQIWLSIFLLLPIGVFFFLIYYRLKKELPPTRRQMVGTLVGLALVANLSVQSTGGLASPIFLVYFGVIFVASVLGDVRLAIATFAGIFVAEVGSSVVREDYSTFGTHLSALLLLGVLSVFVGRVVEYVSQKGRGTKEGRQERVTATDIDRESVVKTLARKGEVGLDIHKALEDALSDLVELAYRSFKCETACMFTYDSKRGLLLMGPNRTSRKTITKRVEMAVGAGVVGWVAKERKSLLTGDFVNPPNTLGYYHDEEQVRSLVCVPIALGAELEGVFVVDSREPNAYQPDDRERLEGLARQASVLIGYARMGTRMEKAVVHFSALQELAKDLSKKLKLRDVLEVIDDAAGKLFDCDVFVILDIDETSGCKVLWAKGTGGDFKEGLEFELGNSLTAIMVKNVILMANEDLREREVRLPIFYAGERGLGHLRSFVGAPLLIEGKVFGGLFVFSLRKASYEKMDSDNMMFLSAQASNAIERAILHEHTEAMAIRDGLTGLYNHRYFQDQLDKRVMQAKKNHKSIALLMMDIDHFKHFNDTYGHMAGDQVLKTIGKILTNWEKELGLAARYGGEEFVALITKEAEKAYEIAEDLRKEVAANITTYDEHTFSVTVSIGVALYPEHAYDKSNLIELADGALYLAKNDGRNRVRTAGELQGVK